MNLFISYSHDDRHYVAELAKVLQDKAQHDVWIDKRRLFGGELWWDTILDNIEQCECFIAILTPHSLTSTYCAAEMSYALALDKPILPLRLKLCDLPQSIKKFQCIEVIDDLNNVLFQCDHALNEIRFNLRQNKNPPLTVKPERPLVPAEHPFEIFAAAEAAVDVENLSLSENLYQKVIEVDPRGLGPAAAKQLEAMHTQRDRAIAYKAIKQLMSQGRIGGAKALWSIYLKQYGIGYDPNGYAKSFSHAASSQDTTLSTSISPPLVQDEKVNQAQSEAVQTEESSSAEARNPPVKLVRSEQMDAKGLPTNKISDGITDAASTVSNISNLTIKTSDNIRTLVSQYYTLIMAFRASVIDARMLFDESNKNKIEKDQYDRLAAMLYSLNESVDDLLKMLPHLPARIQPYRYPLMRALLKMDFLLKELQELMTRDRQTPSQEVVEGKFDSLLKSFDEVKASFNSLSSKLKKQR